MHFHLPGENVAMHMAWDACYGKWVGTAAARRCAAVLAWCCCFLVDCGYSLILNLGLDIDTQLFELIDGLLRFRLSNNPLVVAVEILAISASDQTL